MVASLPASADAAGSGAPAVYQNPVHAQQAADPFVTRIGDRYHVYTTQSWLVNVPVLTSTDLVTWDSAGDAMPQLPKWASWGSTWAPSMLERNGHLVLFYAARHHESGRQCIGRAVATDPVGPFHDELVEPLFCQLERGGTIDPSPFVDARGRPWLLVKSDDNAIGRRTALWAVPLSRDGLRVTGPPTKLLEQDQGWEVPLIENPTMVMVDGQHHLFYSANWWDSPHYAIGHATCAGPTGPCRKTSDRPLVAGRDTVAGVGGQDVFSDTHGRWWLAYHGYTTPHTSESEGGVRSLRVDRLEFTGERATLIEGPSTAPMPAIPVSRLQGEDRYATAVAVGRDRPGSDVVYITSGTAFPDALAASPAAAAEAAPVLLTAHDFLPDATAQELARRRPERIVLVGGTAAVAPEVEAHLAELAPVERVQGADRYETAAALAARTFPAGAPTAHIAPGTSYGDALAAAAAAAQAGGPLLLTGPDGLDASTTAQLERLAPARVVAVGATPRAVRERADEVISGADPYETAAAVAATMTGDHTLVASGEAFPDALAAAALGKRLVLVPKHEPPTAARPLVEGSRAFTVIGGRMAVTAATVAALLG